MLGGTIVTLHTLVTSQRVLRGKRSVRIVARHAGHLRRAAEARGLDQADRLKTNNVNVVRRYRFRVLLISAAVTLAAPIDRFHLGRGLPEGIADLAVRIKVCLPRAVTTLAGDARLH